MSSLTSLTTWFVAFLAVVAPLVAAAGVKCGDCGVNTTLAFIVDTSDSTDNVATSMIAAVDSVANKNGVVLSFADYQLMTWAFLPNDTKHFDTIQELEAYFLAYGIHNIRLNYTPPPKHDDWAYMLVSLYAAVNNAQPNGFIIVLGDEDELCDGRPADNFVWYGGQFNNSEYDALIPHIINIAVAKNVRISFYYFLASLDPAGSQPNGCPSGNVPGNRQWSMAQVDAIAAATHGVSVYNTSVSDSLADEVKQQGKLPGVCPCCTDDSSLGIVVDTSGHPGRVKQQVMDLFWRLNTAYSSGFLNSFAHYYLSSFATPNVTVLSYPTFAALYAAVQLPTFYENHQNVNGSWAPTVDDGNDWLYLSYNLKEMVSHMSYGGYMIVITDEDAFCDAGQFAQNIWTQDLQETINIAVEKQVSLSWYMFQEGPNENSNLIDMCHSIPAVEEVYQGALGRAEAMAIILAGEWIGMIPYPVDTTTTNKYNDAVNEISTFLIGKSQLASCSNCSVNATLGFLVDTSQSADPLKSDIKWTFAQIATLGPQLGGFPGGFAINTFQQTFNTVLKFHTVIDLNTWVQASTLDANRVIFDVPSHNHDDWRYMLEGLPSLIKAVGKKGYIVILGDDNQICESASWGHNSTEPDFVNALILAKQYGVTLSYIQMPTANHWCTPAQMVPGQGLAWILANTTGGFTYFGTDETLVRPDLTAHLFPELIKAGARPVCALQCGVGYVWAVDHCIRINPCDVKPCENGATCHPTLFSTTYECQCADGYWGARCQFPCVPHTFYNQTNHALGLVLDTSDSTAFAILSAKAALINLLNVAPEFDTYFLSTWAYLNPLYKHLPNASAVIAELSLASAGKNKRTTNDSGLATHNDWKYMLDSVEALLPVMGSNGVLVVVTDFEGVCDANKDARMVNGVPRYPMNPDTDRIHALNVLAQAMNIKIIFVTFPSSDYGWCNSTQKTEGLSNAWALVYNTEGTVKDVPEFLSIANTQLVTDEIIEVIGDEGSAQRCNDCKQPTWEWDSDNHICYLA